MNLRHKCFDTEIYEELEQKKLKGMVCFEKDIKKAVLEFINRSDMYHAELAKEIFGNFK